MHEKSSSERLNKYLAFHLGISRRKADELIEHGHVSINGQIATLGSRVEDTQTVMVNGKAVTKKSAYTYIAPAQANQLCMLAQAARRYAHYL